MKLLKLTLIEVSELEEQYRRPYELRADGSVIDKIEEAFDRDSPADARPQLLTDALVRGLSFSSRVENATIVGRGRRGGWDSERYRFLAEILIEEPGRYRQPGSRVVIGGYTDRNERSSDNQIPDDLRFYVNSVIGIRDTPRVDSRGDSYIESKVVRPFQVMNGVYGARRDNDYMARPSDVFCRLTTIRQLGDGDQYDTRVMFASGAAANDRVNNTRGGWLAKLIAADSEGRIGVATHGVDGFNRSRDTASRDLAKDTKLGRNEFMENIMAKNRNMKDAGYFEYADLIEYSEFGTARSLDDETVVYPLRGNDLNYDSMRWDGADAETNVAVTISREVPSIITDHLISSIRFTIDNTETDDNDEPQWDIIDWTTHVEGLDSRMFAEAAMHRIVDEVFMPLTRFNKISLDLEVEADIGGMVTSYVTWDGGRQEVRNFPAFADGIVPPTITRDRNVLNDLSKKYEKIRRKVIDPLLERTTSIFESDSSGADRDRDRDRNRGSDDDRPVIRLF